MDLCISLQMGRTQMAESEGGGGTAQRLGALHHAALQVFSGGHARSAFPRRVVPLPGCPGASRAANVLHFEASL